jgi:hypothetical protein
MVEVRRVFCHFSGFFEDPEIVDTDTVYDLCSVEADAVLSLCGVFGYH